ncbi:MAG: decarboxylase [Actinomycetia bacterium]|nr:decarboxylase [Actinomycetes bacterium]
MDGDPPLPIAAVDGFDRGRFVEIFGGVYEDSPELAAAAWAHRPFADRAALVAAFVAAADDLDADATITLLRAHPELGAQGSMAAASTREQASAGLDRMDGELRARVAADNIRYRERFGFPFIIAVRGLTTADIAAAMTERLGHTPDVELAEARTQVQRIARLRVEQLVAP